jgi:hypothetical protein
MTWPPRDDGRNRQRRLWGRMLEQSLQLAELHPSLTVGEVPLIVARQASTRGEPAQSTLYKPVAAHELEAPLGLGRFPQL